jgi:hypothetical protein
MSINKASIVAFLFSVAVAQRGWTADPVVPPAKKDFLIFLLAGQSNMAGRGKPLETQDQTAHPRVLVLGKEKTWTPAVDPLHWDKPPVVGVGLGLTFARQVAEALPDKTIGLVPAAFGGSAIAEWGQDARHYQNAIDRASVAMHDGTLAGILWHQGESDATPEKAPLYQERLDQLIRNFREDLKSPQVPVIVGTLADSLHRDAAGQVNAALLSLPKRVDCTACAEAKGLQLSADGVHFTAGAYRELGRRYADQWLRLATGAKTQ